MVPGWVEATGRAAPAIGVAALCWVAGQVWDMKLQQTKMLQVMEQLCNQSEAREARDRELDQTNARQDQQIQRLLIRTNLER